MWIPVGKQVRLSDLGSFLVTGVMAELDGRSHLEFDAVLSFSSFDQRADVAQFKR